MLATPILNENQKKELRLVTLESVIFNVLSHGAKPGGNLRSYIDALTKHVGSTFKHNPHIAAKALRMGEKPEFPKIKDLKPGAGF